MREFTAMISRLRERRGPIVADFVADYVFIDRRHRVPTMKEEPRTDRTARQFWDDVLDDPDASVISLADAGLLDEDPSENLWY